MVATFCAFIGVALSATFFMILPMVLLSWLPLIGPFVGLTLLPLSLAPLGFMFLRLWPLPFVIMSETVASPIERCLDLTRGRTVHMLAPVLLLAGTLWL
jgi:hypothetical protein